MVDQHLFDRLNSQLDDLSATRKAIEESRGVSAGNTFQDLVQREVLRQLKSEQRKIERLQSLPGHSERMKAQSLLRRLEPEETLEVIDCMQRVLERRGSGKASTTVCSDTSE